MSQQEHMVNGKGHLVPIEQVSDYDKAKNDLVIEIIDDAESLQAILKEFKKSTLETIMAFMDLAHEKYDAKVGGKKGNVSFISYDGKLRVQVAVSEFMTFDERLQVAKALVDECLVEWTEDVRPEVRALVNMAFEVDKQGNVSPSKVQPLLKLEIKDEKWQRAMDAIRDSLTVLYSKQYVRFYRRSGLEDKWEAISLDLASIVVDSE